MTKNQWDEAIAEFNKAIELNPKLAPPHNNLGNALKAKNRLDEAIAEFNKAIELDPKYAGAHNNLGLALEAKNRLDDAIAEFNKAIELDPKLAPPHSNLGTALKAKNRLDEAIAEYKKAIKIDPNIASAHGALGLALLAKGQFAEARTSTQRALDLLPEKHPLRTLVLRQRDQCDRMLALEAKLFDILADKDTLKDNRERLGFIGICQLQQRHAAAAKLYADAFAADPKLADDLKAAYRYNAACHAALAAAGQGTDAGKLEETDRIRMRKQALDWLRADLDLWSKLWDGGKAADRQLLKQMLSRWPEDTDLSTVRDPDALKKLPVEEQELWRKLWADVTELLKKAGDAK